jgi:hypothetical protein
MNKTLAVLPLFLLATKIHAQTTEPAEPITTPTPTPTNTTPLITAAPPSNPAGRPEGLTIGLGLGVQAPQGAFGLNAVSARLRLASGLTLEPIVIGSFNQSVDVNNNNGVITETDIDTAVLTAAVGVRYPLASRGPVDLLILGVPAITITNTDVDPDGDNNNTTIKTRDLSLNWGIGLEWFIRPNFSFSLNALNPLVVFSIDETEDEAAVNIDTNKDLLLGAIFAPVIQGLFHLYF